VFADIDPVTYNIDPDKIQEAITEKTKAIIPVHYAGQPCHMNRIRDVAGDIPIIEDAAHAIGATYVCKKIGGYGNPTCFSFYATKNMTTGEGGAITTNDGEFAEKVRKLRLHGISKDAWKRYGGGSWRYDIEECGWKYNTTDINAAIGLCQLMKLDEFNRRRKMLSEIYQGELQDIKEIQLPRAVRDHIYHLYPVLVPDRDAFIDYLAKKEIFCSVHFIPLHLHPFYQREFGYKRGDFPVTESVFDREVSLPLYPKMTANAAYTVCEAVEEYFG
jgi:dTDP-4-amino-4,6-dideoxygalactose transaminase